MAVTLVLSIGFDPDLVATRDLILRSAGYLVVSVYSIKEAANRFREGDFDLILLCPSIPTNDKDRLTAWIRSSGSRIPIVSVSQQLYRDDARAGAMVGPEPATLLLHIREALMNTAHPAKRTTMSHRERGETDIQPKNSPIPSTGYRQKMENTNGFALPLVRMR